MRGGPAREANPPSEGDVGIALSGFKAISPGRRGCIGLMGGKPPAMGAGPPLGGAPPNGGIIPG